MTIYMNNIEKKIIQEAIDRALEHQPVSILWLYRKYGLTFEKAKELYEIIEKLIYVAPVEEKPLKKGKYIQLLPFKKK